MTTLPQTRSLKLRRDDWRLFVTIDDPATRNAMTSVLVDDLEVTLTAVENDRSVRALIVQGANGLFCAGADLKTVGMGDGMEGRERSTWKANRRGGELFRRVAEVPATTIAVVDGPAFGGGFGLACCSDIVIGTENARFSLSETTLGLIPAQIGPYVVARLGLRIAKRLALTAARLGGQDAAEIGLVDYFVPTIQETAPLLEEIFEGIRRCAPHANASTKALLLQAMSLDRKAFADIAADAFAASLDSEEGQEGVKAFAEKRRPYWAEDSI
ncbi:enoyl-CoA hydratase/isomerase family protein [Aquisediminimonas profunda]|uniref:enoyl-CoA hydratase/isomerase family protein n=1 Tax=Aquisediminimonas profunda TaxID=1550733 RepID=UPI001C638138|nr:enoyl-CoA hydratase/isomerase family protein [Aquisediminimonas profunda]